MAGKNSTELIFSESAFNKLLGILDKVEQKLTKMQQSTSELKKSSTNITFKFQGLDSLDNFLVKVSRGKVNQFLDLVAGFEKLIGVGTKANSFATFVTTLNQVTGDNLKPLVLTLKQLSGALDDKEAKKLDSLGRSLKAFIAVGASTSSGGGTGAGFDTFLTDLVKSLDKLKVLSNDELDAAAKNLGRFASGMIKIVDNLGNVTTGFNKNNSAAKLGVFFGELAAALRIVSSLNKFLGGGDEIKQLSLAIERLGIGVAGLTRNLEDINVKSTLKLAAFLGGMAVVIRIIAAISGNADKTKALAALFTGIADLVGTVFVKFNTKTTGNEAKIFASIKSRIALILDVIKSIRSIKIKDATGTAAVISGIAALFTSLNNVGDGSKGSGGLTKETISLFKDFIRALQDLNKIKVNKDVATALGGIGDIFANLEKTSTLKNAEGFGGNLSNSVALGFIKGTLAVSIGKFILRLFTDLNPIALTAKFVSGVVDAFLSIDQKITQIINGIVNKIKEVGANLTSFGTSLNSTFGVSSLINSGGFQIAATFDDLANKTKVIGNLSDDALKQVLVVADAVGQKYPVSANQALEAIINLQKAGINAVPDIEAVISPIADLAALSDSGSIDAASKTIIQVISTFKELSDGVTSSYANAATAADILSRGADNSVASVESLSQGLANAGPTASAFGLSLEETVAILGIFENRGIKGAEAGTQLKSMLTNLTRPTDAVKTELRKLGIELTDQKGNFLDINTIMNEFNHSFNDTTKVTQLATNVTGANKEQLDLATKAYASAQRAIYQYQNGLTTGSLDQETANKKIAEYQQVLNNASTAITNLTGDQKTAARITTEISRTQQQNFESIQRIFGTYGQAGAAILTSLGDDAIKGFIDQMGRLPSAAEKAQLLMQSFNGQVEQLRGSGETLLKNFFLPMIETIFYPFVQGLLGITNALLTLDPELVAIISTGVAFGSILATIVGSIAIAAGFFITLGGNVLALATSFLTLGGVVGFITTFAGAIAGLVVGLASFLAIALPIGVILGGLATGFRLLLRIFAENIGGAGDALSRIGAAIGFVISTIGMLGEGIGKVVQLIIGGGGDEGLTGAGKFFASFLNSISDKLNSVAYTILGVADAFEQFVNFFTNGFPSTSTTLDQLSLLAYNPFIKFLLDKGGFEQSTLGVYNLFTTLSDGVRSLSGNLKIVGSGIGDLFRSFTDPQFFEIGKQKIVDGISGISSSVLKAFQTLFGIDLSSAISAFDAGDLSGGIADLLNRAVEGVKNLLLNNRESIKSALTGIFNFFFVPGGFLTIITDFLGLDNVSSFIRGIQDTVSSLFGGVVDTLFNLLAGQDIKTALTNAFGSGIKPVIKFVETLGSVVQNVIGFFQDLIAVIFPTKSQVKDFNLMDVVNNVLTFLTDALFFLDVHILLPLRNLLQSIDLTGIYDFISNLFGQFLNLFNLIGSGDLGGALDSLQGIGSTIVSAIQGILTSAFNVDFAPSDDLLHAVVKTFSAIISTALDGISNLLGFDNFGGLVSGIIKSVTDFFGNNPAEKFAEIGTTVVNALGKAVIDGLSSLADVLGLDPTAIQKNLGDGFKSITDGINAFFLGEDGNGIFSDIQVIFEKLGSAISAVISLLTGNSEIADGGTKLITITDALNGIVDFLSRLVGLGLEKVGDSLRGIADFFDRLSRLPPDQLLMLAGALGVLAVALLPIIAPGAASAILSGFGAITTGLGIFAAILLVGNVAENLGTLADVFRDLLNLDIAGAASGIIEFFGNIAAGVTFDILGLFGIDNINGQTEENVKTTISTIASAASEALTNIGNGLSNFVQTTVIPAKDRLTEIVQGALDFFRGVGDVIGGIMGRIGLVLSVVGTLLLSPIIAVFKVVQGFTELPQEQKDRVVKFFVALGLAFLVMNAGTIASALGSLGGFLLTLGSTAVAGGLSAFAALPGILSGIGSSLLAAGSSIVSFVAPIAAVIIIFTVLAAAVQNLDKLFSAIYNIIALLGSIVTLDIDGIFQSIGAIIGDVIDFIGSTLVDAFFTIAEFFGVSEILGQTKDDIKRTLSQVVTVIKAAFIGLGLTISKFFRDTFNDLSQKLAIAAADLRLVSQDAAARVRTIGQDPTKDSFFKAQAVFDPQTFNLSGLSAALVDTTIDQNALRDFAIKNAGLIKDALLTQIQSGDQSGDGLFKIQTGIQFAIQSNNLESVIDQVFSLQGDAGKKAQETFMAGLNYALSTGSINQTEASKIVSNIFEQVSLGTLTPEAAAALLNTIDFTNTKLTPEQVALLKQQIADGLTKAATDAKATAEATPVVVDASKVITFSNGGVGNATKDADLSLPVAVTVEPKLIPTVATDVKNAQFYEDVKQSISDNASAAGVSIVPEVPVTPVFTGVTNQEDVTKFQGQIKVLNDGLVTSNEKFTEFAGSVNDNVTNMQTLADKVATTSTEMQSNFAATLLSFNTFKDGVLIGYNEIAGAIGRVILAMSLMSLASTVILPNVTNNMETLKTVFIDMGAVAKTAFDKAKESVNSLDAAIKDLINDINYAIGQAGQLQGVQVQGGREKGGPVWKGLFEVGENDKPELLFQNGKIFLISPTGGSVEPISPVGDATGINSSFGLQQPVPKASSSGLLSKNETSITLTEGDIVLNISGGGVTQETINTIQRTVRTELDNRSKSISERLRTAGRS